MSYAEGTKVPVERSRAEAEKLLKRAGATKLAFMWEDGQAQLACQLEGLPIVFKVSRVYIDDLKPTKRARTGAQLDSALDQEERRRWRALVLILKAKLELIESGQSTAEREFLADIMLPGGRTMGDEMIPKIRKALTEGKMPRLLMPGG